MDERSPQYCPTHGAPLSPGVMIGGLVWECGCAIIETKEKYNGPR